MSRGSARFFSREFIPFAWGQACRCHFSSYESEPAMAKNQNTYEKRRRETEKKFRADEKRKRRLARKLDPPPANTGVTEDRTEDPEENE
jgi:hypothetical protein